MKQTLIFQKAIHPAAQKNASGKAINLMPTYRRVSLGLSIRLTCANLRVFFTLGCSTEKQRADLI